MRSRTALVLVVFVLALAAAVWRWQQPRGERAHEESAAATEAATAAAERAAKERAAAAGELPPPAWFVREDITPRRIAGRVTLDGKPAAATVTLISNLTRAGRGKPVEVATAADGVFDLGTWPAASYTIAATSPSARAAIMPLDLTDPTLATDKLELRMRSCVAHVAGTITDAVGAAIEDAQVAHEGITVARSDARGAYRVCVSFGQLDLEYAAEGYGAVVLGMHIVGSTTQDVVLVPAAAIAGRVIRAEDGAPVAEAAVLLNPQEWTRDRAAQRGAITDASGAFRIEGLAPGRYRAWGFADGYSAESATPVEAQLGVTNEIVVTLVARSRIRGTVRHGATPVVGAMVAAVRAVPTSRSRTSPTQPDGTFVLDDVPIGDLVFSVDGYDVTAPAAYRTEPGKAHDGVVIQVEPRAAIRGVVTRAREPVEGATVWGGGNDNVITDVAGRYEITGLLPGTYQIGAGSDEAGAFVLPRPITVAAGEQKTLDLELDLAAEIAGTVVDAKGKPVPDVFVRWTHTTTQDEGRGVTDAAGRYRCRAMQGGGTYKALVFASAASQRPFPAAPGTSYPAVDVADGAAKIEGITIAIDRQELSIAGVVVDSTGAPVVDAQVKATPTDGQEPHFDGWRRLPMTATDSDGRFTIGGLVPGTYAVQARSADGGEGVAVELAAGATGVKIVLTRPGSIEGQLVGFARPAVVYATPWNAPHKILPGAVDGASFRIAGVKPGRYLVNGQNATEGDAKLVDVRVGAKATVTLTATGQGAIEGKVLDWKTRAPIAGAGCRAVMSIDGQQGSTNWDMATAPKSDATGRVVVDPAPAGNVTIVCEVQQPRHSPPSVDVVIERGGRVSVELYSATFSVENPGTVGIQGHWAVTPPRIAGVDPGSPAARAGLQAGDLVVAIDGAPIAGLNGTGVAFLIADHPIGSKVGVTVQRGAQRKTVELEVVVGN